jgi:hypothetical protein
LLLGVLGVSAVIPVSAFHISDFVFCLPSRPWRLGGDIGFATETRRHGERGDCFQTALRLCASVATRVLRPLREKRIFAFEKSVFHL